MQGKVAGFNISSSGDPNKSSSVILRGASTVNSPSGPFYVIDGVPGADISLVAPADIETIDVLKDAAATAIYGNRAASGVIMVTTKKGNKGNTQVSYSGIAGIETVSSRLNLMDADQHRAYIQSQGLSYNPIDDAGDNTNWQDQVMRSQAFSHNHNLSFSGGGDHNTYSASVNYINKEGIMLGSSQERLIGRLNIEQRALNDKLKFSINVTNSNTKSNLVPLQNTIFDQITKHLPVSSVYNTDGSYFENFNTPGYFNPVALINNAVDDNSKNNLVASFGTEVKLPFGLKYNLLISHQTLSTTSEQFYNSYYNNYNAATFKLSPEAGLGTVTSQVGTLFGKNGSAYKKLYQNKQNTVESFLTWDKSFGNHSINAVIGYSYLSNVYGDEISSSSTNFASDFVVYNNLSLGNPYAISSFRIDLAGGVAEKRMISDFARVNYNFNNKYLVQASIRRDGSSVFGANYRNGYFPAVGLGWRIDQENFMENQKVFSDLKLRASYGVTGNSDGISPFNSQLVYGVTGTYYNNGIQDNAYGPIQGSNPNLRWESTSTSNLGLDFTLINGIVSGSIDVYDKSTKDMLFKYSVSPALVPGGAIWANGGAIGNKGIELLLNFVPIKKKDFTWTSSVNLAHNKNKITSLANPFSDGDSILYASAGGEGQTGATLQILKVGKPIGQFFSFDYQGKNSAGESQFLKKDGTLTNTPLVGSDYFYVGDAQPKLLLGWSNTVNYKNFDFNVFIRGVFGNKIFNASRANLSYTPYASTNNLSSYVNADDLVSDAKNNYFSTRYIENGDYLRLDNATLGYSFNPTIKGVKKLRLYITSENLFTITNYTGIDPEVNQGGIAPGVDNNNFYPKTKSFLIGLNITL
ncbi:TonB-dependent receptor [Arcticibacter svalbardensis MN12-7]|uniref:TonB-dependent receptor n=1 Tax=Arcticibacter svalbardensis MN12-7 TaxID=1150600 RepID=R9GV59_9SPHI|nr:TonB-dependent receptor [Arcticibacter svalbardensis MN12-7]